MTAPLKLLLVDDNPDDRALVVRELREEFPGLEAWHITNVAELEAALEEGGFDLVLTDYQIRWTNGLDVLRAVKRRFPQRPVVMFTGTGDEEVAVAAMKAGLDDYLVKSPKHFRKLRAVVSALLARARDQQCLRETKDALQDAEARLRLAIRASHVGFADWDLQTGEVLYSAEWKQQLGYEAHEIAPRPGEWESRLHPDDRQATLRAVNTYHERPWPHCELQYRLRHKDGSYRWFLTRATLVLDAEGAAQRLLVLQMDITETKHREEEHRQLQERLRHAHKMESLGTLAAGVAHDFNNVLTAILGYACIAEKCVPPGTDAAEAVLGIRQCVVRATGITGSLLTFSRRAPVQMAVVDLRPLIHESMELLNRLLPASIVVVEDFSAPGDVRVQADAEQLQQVIMNLAVNARDAMPSGGTLRLAVHPLPSRVSCVSPSATGAVALVIEDNGSGMSRETLEHVFEPFFTTKSREEGTGLGLAIVHGIVKSHGGEIDIDSELGRGTRVTVTLPVHQEAP